MRKIVSISSGDPDRTSFVTEVGGYGIINQLDREPEISEQLGRTSTLTLHFKAGTPISTSDDQYLKRRRVIRLNYDDSSFWEWRIEEKRRSTSGLRQTIVECSPIWHDLGTRRIRKTLADGFILSNIPFYGFTVDTLLGTIFSADYNAPDYFLLGNIPVEVENEVISVLSNNSSHLEVLQQVCVDLELEWESVWDEVESKYVINLYQTNGIGGGSGLADDHPIEMGPQYGNRIDLEKRSERGSFFSRIVPIGGVDNEGFGIQDADWNIDSATYDGGANETTIVLNRRAIVKDGYPNVSHFGNDSDGFFPIVSTSRPHTIIVTGDASAMTKGLFVTDGTGTRSAVIEDPDAIAEIGEVEFDYRRTDISPFNNLLEDFGVSTDLTEWSGGAPVGTEALGGAILNEETGEGDVQYGNKAVNISGDTGDGFQTIELPINPTTKNPYFSLWVAGKVVTGGFRVLFIDGDGTEHPERIVAESTSTTTRAIEVSGFEPSAGNARIRIELTADSSEVIIDSWTLVQSPSAREFSDRMGPRSLFIEASKELSKAGGLSSEIWEADFYDRAYEDAGLEEVTIGSFCRIRDSYDPDTVSYGIDFVARVISLEYVESGINGRVKKRARLARRGSKLAGFFSQNYITKTSAQSSPSIQIVDRDPQRVIVDITEFEASEILTRLLEVDGYNCGLIVTDSLRWANNLFADFLDQPVRSTDSPSWTGGGFDDTLRVPVGVDKYE